ncbi:MAG: hypothetical protein ACLFPJ_00880 [Candidatus Woesearchaeota archaeon]
MLNKKGIEIGLNTIVVAVIALAVLLVVLLVFTGRFGLFSDQLQKCENLLGEPKDKDDCEEENGRVAFVIDDNEVCCVSKSSIAPGD